jgi:hypothetical protein
VAFFKWLTHSVFARWYDQQLGNDNGGATSVAHVHLPKPLHGWREFLGEVGIIVLGVLIALGAEQAIEHLNWLHKRSQVEQSMREELGNDDGVVAAGLIDLSRCSNSVLDRTQQAIDSDADRHAVATLARSYPVLHVFYDQDAWNAAKASEALMHGGEDSTLQWAAPYAFVPPLNDALARLYVDLSRLKAWSGRNSALSAIEKERATLAIEAVREDHDNLIRSTAAFMMNVRAAGIVINPVDQATIYESEHNKYGDCVIDSRKVDLSDFREDLISSLNPAAR